MPLLCPLSASEQAAAHLRAELERGRWIAVMPGATELAADLGVNHKTIKAALRQLEHEGLLVGQGQGRRRRIVPPSAKAVRLMRIAILDFEPIVCTEGYMVELQHQLLAAGHTVFYAEKSLMELGMNLERVRRLVKRTIADAWVICAGSREVLDWFCTQPVPAFALFGRREGLPMAAMGTDGRPAVAAATRHLIGLGHQRIVMINRRLRRLPEPGPFECAFVDELKAHDVPIGDFNLPDWEETRDGLQALLSSLFRVTPPTALIIDEAPFFIAAQQFLAARGIRVPQQVSLICTEADPAFTWCTPAISQMRWDSGPVVRRIVRWAAAVSRGRRDARQSNVPVEFVVGGTTGPAPVDSGQR